MRGKQIISLCQHSRSNQRTAHKESDMNVIEEKFNSNVDDIIQSTLTHLVKAVDYVASESAR